MTPDEFVDQLKIAGIRLYLTCEGCIRSLGVFVDGKFVDCRWPTSQLLKRYDQLPADATDKLGLSNEDRSIVLLAMDSSCGLERVKSYPKFDKIRSRVFSIRQKLLNYMGV